MNERHYFPLSTDQNVVVRWSSGAPASLLNLAVRIDIDDDINEELFLEAARLTVERLQYCRIRLHKDENGNILQYVTDMNAQSICAFHDFSDVSEAKISKQLSKWAEEPFPNHLLDVQLYRMCLLRCKDNKHILFFCGHHNIMDIYSVIYTITYVDKVYYALISGTPLPKEGADVEKVVTERNNYLETERCQKDKQWWYDTFNTEPLFTSINGLGGKEFIKGKRYGHDRNILQIKTKEYVCCIPKELSEKIVSQAMENNISPYMYYSLAMRTYLGYVCKTDDVTLQSVVSLRASLSHKSSGLTRAAGLNFRTILDGSETFHDAIKQLDLTHKDCLRHVEVPDPNNTVKEYYNCPYEDNYHSVTMSYIPFIDYNSIHLSVKAKKIDAGVAITPLYVLLMPLDNTGDMYATYQCAIGYVKPENVEKYHSFMLKFLEAGISDPRRTIGELTEACL